MATYFDVLGDLINDTVGFELSDDLVQVEKKPVPIYQYKDMVREQEKMNLDFKKISEKFEKGQAVKKYHAAYAKWQQINTEVMTARADIKHIDQLDEFVID